MELNYLNKSFSIFEKEIKEKSKILNGIISQSSFLILGGAGSIGQEVVKLIFKNNPKKIHVVDISENNLVELVRDIRSSYGYIDGDFSVYALDISSNQYDKFISNDGKYDYVLNLSALKHVRSEKDPYTLMRLIETNIFNVEKTIQHSISKGTKKYFSVSTDKAANPANIMGASKRIMELFMFKYSNKISVSSARFANVLFSDGSLLFSFNQRLLKNQPIVAPSDIKRYFISKEEAAELCIMAAVFGENREIFFPKLNPNQDLKTFKELAISFLKSKGYSVLECSSEKEARLKAKNRTSLNQWPCYFSESETTGEKPFEEFYSKKEKINLVKFENIGIIVNERLKDFSKIKIFKKLFGGYSEKLIWERAHIIDFFKKTLEEFNHIEKKKFLDEKM